MSEFKLQIVTPDGISFDGVAEQVIVRTTTGDMGVLKGHTDYVAPLAIGVARVKIDGVYREAACNGGMIRASKEGAQIIATTFEWADEIDVERAMKAKEKALKALQNKKTETEARIAETKLKRAVLRLDVGK